MVITGDRALNAQDKIGEISVALHFYYLGVDISASRYTMVKNAKARVTKLAAMAKVRLEFKSTEAIKEMRSWFIQSILRYICPPLLAARLITEREVGGWFIAATRMMDKVHNGISNDGLRFWSENSRILNRTAIFAASKKFMVEVDHWVKTQGRVYKYRTRYAMPNMVEFCKKLIDNKKEVDNAWNKATEYACKLQRI